MIKLRYPVKRQYSDGSCDVAANVVTLEALRHILWRMGGFACRREGEDLLVFKSTSPSFYATPIEFKKEDAFFSFRIDEGFYQDCLFLKQTGAFDCELKLSNTNPLWSELVDGTAVLGFFKKAFMPDVKLKPSPGFISATRTSQFYAEQMAELLVGYENKDIEFYTTQCREYIIVRHGK